MKSVKDCCRELWVYTLVCGKEGDSLYYQSFAVRRVFFSMQEKIMSVMRELIAFRSTYNQPEEIQKCIEYIKSFFNDDLFKVLVWENNGNHSLIVSLGNHDPLHPRILLNGHIDVVEAEDHQFTVQEKDGIAYGRGTADMKGMVAVMMVVMKELAQMDPVPNVGLLLTDDEEIGGENGMGYAVQEKGLRPNFVICADGTSEKHEITVKHKGSLWIELQARGKAGHAAHPWEGDNALDHIIHAIQKVRECIGDIEPEAWKSTLNVARIETPNTTPNKIPDQAKAIVDIRFTEALVKNSEELLARLKEVIADDAITIEVLSQSPLLFVDENNSYLQSFKKVKEGVVAETIPLTYMHGATDARFFGELGIPAVIWGPIGGGMHSKDEWVDMKSLVVMQDVLNTFIQESIE